MRRILVIPALVGALALAGGASASTPRFAVFDVHTDLAGPSHNVFGDVKVWKRQAALAERTAGSTLVRCGGDCTFGSGWLAFTGAPALAARDVASAKARRTKLGWGLVLTLTPRGSSNWTRFSRNAALSGKTRGVPDPLVLVLDGSIVAQPLANQLSAGRAATVTIPGLSRANALRGAKLFG
jgi:hypothetical protein